jgi:hypothetical protein
VFDTSPRHLPEDTSPRHLPETPPRGHLPERRLPETPDTSPTDTSPRPLTDTLRGPTTVAARCPAPRRGAGGSLPRTWYRGASDAQAH